MGQRAIPIDRAAVTYGQNRAVQQKGEAVYYVMRDIAGQPDKVALFRVARGQARQISQSWEGAEIVWSYVSPQGSQLLLARAQGDNWNWTLYRIGAKAVAPLQSATVPGDVITVYWSPDEKHIIGAAGEKLWLIDIPSLKATPLGKRTNWNADDVSWLGQQASIAVAAGGELWRVEVPGGAATKLWRFPAEYWK